MPWTIQTFPSSTEWYVTPVDPNDWEPWRSWLDPDAQPNQTFLRKSEAPENLLIDPEDVGTVPEETQADASDWRILPEPE